MATQRKPWEPPTAAQITDRWRLCTDDQLDTRRAFGLNDAFFHGDQWVAWNNWSANVDLLEFTDPTEASTRATVNKILPRTITYMARLLSTPLAFEPRPDGIDSEALRKARLAGQVLEVKAHRNKWEDTRRDLVHYVLLGGVAAIAVEPGWTYAADAPVFDQETGDAVKLPSKPATKLTALSALEFGIEPGSRSTADARYWIRCTTLTPEQAMEEYDLDAPPPADSNRGTSVMSRAILTRRKEAKSTASCLVYVYYERPSSRSPGCVIHVVGGEVRRQEPWTFSFDWLNLVTFRQTDIAGSWKGDTILSSARPLQVGINRAYTTINNHIGKADNARIVVPMGSMVEGEDDFTGDAGEIIRYDSSIGGGPPQWMQPPQIARWLREHIDNLQNELDDLFSAHQVSRGVAPGDRNSGLALSILAEKDETPLGLMATNQQQGWQAVAEMVLMTERDLLERMANAYGEVDMQAPQMTDVIPTKDNQAVAVEWTAGDLSMSPVVHVPLDSVMPRSKAAVQDALLKFAAVPAFAKMFGELSPSELAEVLQVPDVTAFAIIADMQTAEAQWENGRMAKGAGDDEVAPKEWQDHDKHVVEHNRLRASAAYRDASPQIQQFVDLHVQAHAMLAAERMQQQAQAQMAMQQQQASLPPAGQPAGALPPGPQQQEQPAA